MQYFSYGLQQITLHKGFLFLKNEKKNYEVARFKIYNHILPISPLPPISVCKNNALPQIHCSSLGCLLKLNRDRSSIFKITHISYNVQDIETFR